MDTERINVEFTSKPITGIVQAIPTIRDMTIVVDDPDEHGCVGPNDSYQVKMIDLGIKPGERFFMIIDESMVSLKKCYTYRPRNAWSAIWSRKRLKEHQKGNQNCDQCEHSFGHKHYKKFSFKHCRDCEHGLNIVASFIIDENYRAYFDPKKNQT